VIRNMLRIGMLESGRKKSPANFHWRGFFFSRG
jgi:hypothetical protein